MYKNLNENITSYKILKEALGYTCKMLQRALNKLHQRRLINKDHRTHDNGKRLIPNTMFITINLPNQWHKVI